MYQFCLPFHQTLSMLGENGGWNLGGEIWVRQFLFDLGNFSLILFHFLDQPDFLGGDVNQSFKR